MGKLIVVVGNVGVGKTTFTQRLCEATGWTAALEDHAERAFHAELASGQHQTALANQIDFLLMRAEQERAVRNGSVTGVQDGGLDQDFWGFTHLFARTGYLQPSEFAICQRLYSFARAALPPPDLYVHLHAPLEVLHDRYVRRNRNAEVTTIDDIAVLEALLAQWIGAIAHAPVITLDVAADDVAFAATIPDLLPRLRQTLNE
jgi:deoxyadenosine/deoxycytidine kinase